MSSNNVKKKFYEDMQSFYDQQDKYNFLYAISKCEIREYLRGDGKYRKYSASDFYIAYEPTDTCRVIKDVFYAEAAKVGAVDMFFDYLRQMAEESALGAYLSFDYVGALKYEDKEHTIKIEPYADEEPGAIYCWITDYDYGENPEEYMVHLCGNIQDFIEGMIKVED